MESPVAMSRILENLTETSRPNEGIKMKQTDLPIHLYHILSNPIIFARTNLTRRAFSKAFPKRSLFRLETQCLNMR